MAGVFFVATIVSTQELSIDFQFNCQSNDNTNYLSFRGPNRLGSVNRDTLDAVTSASKQKSTALFTIGYHLDLSGGTQFPSGLRGLLFYPVSPNTTKRDDNLTVAKAQNGVITIQYVHRGIAYRIITDNQGRVTLPRGNYSQRVVGFIQGSAPQVISRDFSSNGAAAGIDWAKVWDSRVQAGGAIQGALNAVKTGDIENDWENSSLGRWSGPLQFSFDGRILKINGTLRYVRG